MGDEQVWLSTWTAGAVQVSPQWGVAALEAGFTSHRRPSLAVWPRSCYLTSLGLDRLICEMGRLITPISHGREDFMSQRIPVERGPALSKFSTMIHCYYLKCIIIPQGEKALEVDSCFSGWFFEFLSRYLSSPGLSRPFWNFLGMCVAPPSSCFPRFLSCYFLAASTLDGGASEILRCV